MGVDNAVCLAWLLAEALRRARSGGQARVVGYLEAVLEEVLFETKTAPSLVSHRSRGR
jgi:hypothetical protein